LTAGIEGLTFYVGAVAEEPMRTSLVVILAVLPALNATAQTKQDIQGFFQGCLLTSCRRAPAPSAGADALVHMSKCKPVLCSVE
jgi:hypothetical protein